jgi:hypothetical protein
MGKRPWMIVALALLFAAGCEEEPPVGDDDDTTAAGDDDDSSSTGDDDDSAGVDDGYDWTSDWEALTQGVETIESGESLPSSTVVWGDMAFPVILDEANLPFVTAARVGDGRAFQVGHESYIGGGLTGAGDTGQLIRNAVGWVSAVEEPVIGVEEGLSSLTTWLQDEGYSVEITDLENLDGYDVYCTTTYDEPSGDGLTALRAWLPAGGGLIAGGHAWWWGYENDNAAENYPGNKLLYDAGLVVTSGWVSAGTDTVGDEAPSVLLNATRALGPVGDHLDDSDPLDHDEQLLASSSISLAIDHLPLSWDFFDSAMELSQTTPVIPTAADPVVPADQPIEALVVHLDAKLAADLPAEEVLAHPAGEDFPGVPDSAATETLTVTVEASYEGRDSRYLYSGAGADVWRGTGAWIPAGELVTVTVPAGAEGQGLGLLVGAHTDTLWSTGEWSRFPEITRSYPLDDAETAVATAFGGLAYVTVPAGVDLGEIEVTLDGVILAPRFVRGETELADWTAGIRDLPAPWAELENASFVLTVPSSEIRDLDDPHLVVDLWKNVLDGCADLAAIDHDRVRAERMVVDRQISAGWMHSGYPIMAHDVSAPDLLGSLHLIENGDWGAFHELGHNHQLSSWLLPGTTEASVNLWSVYVYEEVLGLSRDEAHPSLDPDDRADRIDDYLAGGADFYADWNVWTALETYLQLQEAFGWGLYFDLFAEYNDLTALEEPSGDQQIIDQWVERSSLAAGVDLGPFYVAWGFPVSQDVLDATSLLPVWVDDPMTP